MKALVTGASRGIGAATALALADKGWDIILHYNKSSEKALELADQIRKKGRSAWTFCADFSKPGEVGSFCRRVLKEQGCPDVIVNNAGISITGLIQDMDDEKLDALLNVNLRAVITVCREFASPMIERKSGCIINLSSMWGQTGASFETVYSAAKGGVDAFTKALAKELGPSGIRVNAVSPGCILTDMCACYTPAELEAVAEETALGKNGTAENIADAVAFLASPEASYITGQIIGVNGGIL